MQCPKCGAQCAQTQLFCTHCGQPLSQAEMPVEEKVETVSQQPAAEPIAQEQEAAAVPTPVIQEKMPEKPKKPQKEKTKQPKRTEPKSTTGAAIISVILCNCIVLFTFLAISLQSVRMLAKENIVENALQTVDLAQVPVYGENTMADLIAMCFEQSYTPVTADEVQSALEDRKINREVSDLLIRLGDLLSGDPDATIPDQDELMELVDTLCQGMGVNLSNADRSIIADNLDRAFDTIGISDSAVPGMSLPITLVLIPVLAVVVLAGIILLINRRRYAAFAYVGASLLVGGFLSGSGALALHLLLPSEANSLVVALGLELGKAVYGSFGLVSLIVAILGVLMIAAYVVFRVLASRKNSLKVAA